MEAPQWTEILLHSMITADRTEAAQVLEQILTTGLAPVPNAALSECAACIGLPCRLEPVTPDHLLALLLEAESAAPARPTSEVVA